MEYVAIIYVPGVHGPDQRLERFDARSKAEAKRIAKARAGHQDGRLVDVLPASEVEAAA